MAFELILVNKRYFTTLGVHINAQVQIIILGGKFSKNKRTGPNKCNDWKISALFSNEKNNGVFSRALGTL